MSSGFYKDFVAVFLAKSNDCVSDQIGSHTAGVAGEDADNLFTGEKTQIGKALCHVRRAGKPDNLDGLPDIN